MMPLLSLDPHYHPSKEALVHLRAVTVQGLPPALMLRIHCRLLRRLNLLNPRLSRSRVERRRPGRILTMAHCRLTSQLRNVYASCAMRRLRMRWLGGNTSVVCGGSLRRSIRRRAGLRMLVRSEGDLARKEMERMMIRRWMRCSRAQEGSWDGLRGGLLSRVRSVSSG